MSQISPPIRIALAGAILFLAVWMVALRGGSETAAPPAAPAAGQANVATGAPAQSAPGRVVEAAQGAATQAEGAAAAAAGEAPAAPTTATAPGTAPASGAPATVPAAVDRKAAASSGLPLSVLRAIARKKVVVMLFWNPRAGDDRAVRREMRGVSTHKGKVVKHVANIKNVARYASITRGVDLNQSPTIVVIDRKLGATPLVGFTATEEIEQIVADALRTKR